jgi:putative ABC transport system permease protein
MRERGREVPVWVRRVLRERVVDEVFEPAWHEALARHLEIRSSRRGIVRGMAELRFRLQTLGLVLQCIPVTAGRGDGDVRMFVRDVRLAMRGLRRSPAFLALTVATMGLGIGATTAIFSVMNTVLLHPLPFAHPDRLVTMEITSSRGYPVSISLPNFRDWGERSHSFESYGMYAPWRMVRQSESGASIVDSYLVAGDFFDVVGVGAAIGREITRRDAERGAEPIAVLSYGYWQQELGGDPAVVGRTMMLDDRAVTVVGVTPAGFAFPTTGIDMYLPMGMLPTLPWDNRDSSFGGRPIGRLASNATIASAQADMDGVVRAIETEEGRPFGTTRVRALTDWAAGSVRTPVLLLMGAAAFVLLIAMVNVANLLLARGESRRREVAVRLALGAGRGAVVRQLLAEGLSLAFAGALLGVLVAFAGVALIRTSVPLPALLVDRIRVSASTLAFAAGVSTLAGLFFGVVPALRLSNGTTRELREGTRTTEDRARQRLRSAFVVAEIALALVLTVGASLMIRSLSRLHSTDAGFATDHIIMGRVSVPRSADTREKWIAWYESLAERMRAEPGVRNAAATLLVPLGDRSWELLVLPEGEPYDPRGGESVLFDMATPEYFGTFAIPILKGRNFTAMDRNGSSPVAIIDETMAAKFWPGEDPIGKRITVDQAEGSTPEHPVPVYRTVIGVAPNIRHYDLRSQSRIQVWIPVSQSLREWGTSLSIAVRTTGDPSSFAGRFREIVQSIDRDVPISGVSTMDAYVAYDLRTDRAMRGVLGTFGGLALGLAAIGVFGVMSLIVAMRTREIGVRVAIGAEPGRIVRLVLGRTMFLSALGTAIGLAAAAALSGLLGSFLYEVSPLEPGVYAVASLALLVLTMLASLVPALRATRIDPVTALQDG